MHSEPTAVAVSQEKVDIQKRLYDTLYNIVMLIRSTYNEEKIEKECNQILDHLEPKEGKNLLLDFYHLLQHFIMPSRPWATMDPLYTDFLNELKEDASDTILNQKHIRECIGYAIDALNKRTSARVQIQQSFWPSLTKKENRLLERASSPISFYYAIFILRKTLNGGRNHPEYFNILTGIHKSGMPDFLADTIVYLEEHSSLGYRELLEKLDIKMKKFETVSDLNILFHLSIMFKQEVWCKEEFLRFLLENSSHKNFSADKFLSLILQTPEGVEVLKKAFNTESILLTLLSEYIAKNPSSSHKSYTRLWPFAPLLNPLSADLDDTLVRSCTDSDADSESNSNTNCPPVYQLEQPSISPIKKPPAESTLLKDTVIVLLIVVCMCAGVALAFLYPAYLDLILFMTLVTLTAMFGFLFSDTRNPMPEPSSTQKNLEADRSNAAPNLATGPSRLFSPQPADRQCVDSGVLPAYRR